MKRFWFFSGAAFFLILAAFLQLKYDFGRQDFSSSSPPPSPTLVQGLNLGLDTAAASMFWIDVRSELPFSPRGPEYFLAGLDLINSLDPAWNTPYIFTVLALPYASNFPDAAQVALVVGERGLEVADPDWRLPFYVGTLRRLEFGDVAGAAIYFNRAANSPDVPESVRRFALNYGIHPNRLSETLEIWKVVLETTPQEELRQAARAHIEHLEMLGSLNAAVAQFNATFGAYPKNLSDLVDRGFLPSIPSSPFGFSFKIYDGGVVGISS